VTRRLFTNVEKRARRLRALAAYEQNGRCVWCGVKMLPPGTDDDRAATAEHLTDVTRGGRTNWWNVRAACRKCNNERCNDPAPILMAGDDNTISPFAVLADAVRKKEKS
jgi:5-methylcytosine-specific restriction endonuclease McrA